MTHENKFFLIKASKWNIAESQWEAESRKGELVEGQKFGR